MRRPCYCTVSRTKYYLSVMSGLSGGHSLHSSLLKMTAEMYTPNPRRAPLLPHEAQCTWSSGGGRISFSRLS